MRYFFDTEFYEDGQTIDLISIGMVADDGREFYAINQDAQLHRVSPWVRQHVLPQLPLYGDLWMPAKEIAEGVRQFAQGKPEFWAYFADYDWVVIAQLFGTMMDLPDHFPKFCMDLKQLAVMKGNPTLPQQETGEHNALADARWNQKIYEFLTRE